MTQLDAPAAAAPAARSASDRVPQWLRRMLANAPHRVSVAVGIVAAVSLLSSVSAGFRHLTQVPRDYLNDYIILAPDTSFAWALVLAFVAIALSARKRIAWWLLVGYVILFGLSNALYLFDYIAEQNYGAALSFTEKANTYVGLAVQIFVLLYLIATYRQFYTKVRRAAVLQAGLVLAGGLAIATLIGWGLVELVPHTLRSSERLLYAFGRVVTFAAIDTRTFDGRHTYGFINSLLGLLGALALIAAALVLLRSQRSNNSLTDTDEELLRALVARYGDDDSLAFFSTRRDKAVVFAPNGLAAITYRVEVGACMAGGDPVGDPKHWGAAVRELVAVADRYGWQPCAMGVSPAGAQVYADAGFITLNIGDEAIVKARAYSLSGPDMRMVRQAVMRCRRADMTTRIRRHRDLSPEEMAAAIKRADDWRDTEEERGFAMALGRLGDPRDGDCILVEAVQHAGTDKEHVVGMLSFVPWGPTGASLDLMRRDRSSINGIVELMVTEFAEGSEEFGITEISLNFAAFREIFEYGNQIGAGPAIRLMHGAFTFMSRYVQMESLYKSNAKFLPEWRPRYLCYEDSRAIPRVGMAALLTEGFVKLPRFGRPPRSSRVAPAVPSGVDVPALVTSLARDKTIVDAGPRRPEQVRVRLAKVDELIAAGIDPYPPARPPTHSVVAAAEAVDGTDVRIAGRVLRLRDFGKVIFAVVRDWSGEIQVLLDSANIASDAPDFAAGVDLGDLVEITGTMGRSRRGEQSVLATDWRMLGKCLHPLPDKWSGLTDPEARVRQRYVDLAINESSRETLRIRSAAVKAMRDHLAAQDFLEVETPILQRIHGGANAQPFLTHINAYNLDLYLRIAPELYLKRLCVGGVERVFELGRNFRNEGVDFSHNPEFTSLEAYAAHGDYQTMRILTQEMIQAAATAAHGEPVVLRPDLDGRLQPVDISGEWPVKTVHDAVSEALGEEVRPDSERDELRRLSAAARIPFRQDWGAGHLVLEMYEHLVESKTTRPTFYQDFPVSVSPLTRQHRTIPGLAERWDLVAWGFELGTAYSELTDPIEQRKRLTAQSLLAAGGDAEAMELDEDFLQALEHAMPPTGGLGIGVDRVIMMITGRSIRETLPFPLAKPRLDGAR
ncbi:bifunctional lysylphosphatidylglycerol synthetase/lysine--tRNA ligase LysX [Jongsikchunia kroppenstedtii]|uniref:bifunctional lysylphosphatidylglycerol synthetase/lysine--tRNA ligase LysX n=1 Tax=Jongsikchunia kroppenstedtii TaxID=1121721 RepID=UPI000382B7A1|nr:bifunctional lysylphosphatidylglycerol synthetase/lysine--tRNA ligase LysX [Jongsikchunia kroppenstedtii]